MKNFSASLLYRSDHTPAISESDTVWEEQIILFKAESAESAWEIAKSHGASNYDEYETKDHGHVKWKFIKVIKVVEVLDKMDSKVVEIFYRFLKSKEATALLLPLPFEDKSEETTSPLHPFDGKKETKALSDAKTMPTLDTPPGWHSTLIGSLHFLGPAEGERERKFQAAVVQHINGEVRYQAAYLAKVQYLNERQPRLLLGVVLGYGVDGDDSTTLPLMALFRPMFLKGTTLDIMYLPEDIEEQLRDVCPPFYERAHRRDNPYLSYAQRHSAMTVIACPHVAAKQYPMLEAIRARPKGSEDSGWRCFCHSGLTEDPKEQKLITIKQLLALEPNFEKYLEKPLDTFLWRPSAKHPWEERGHEPTPSDVRRGEGEASSAVVPADSADAPRQYLKLQPGNYEVGDNLYYECYGCGDALASLSKSGTRCRCGNFSISKETARIMIRDEAKIRVFRQG